MASPDPAGERSDDGRETARRWLSEGLRLSEPAAAQLVRHLADSKHILGALPSQDTLILERFFDEAGGMQLVLHSPFGSRINRAWGLALRKKFCRTFNFELQAAATEDGLLLSLGPQHSFPLDDVFRYLHPETVRDVLIQAMLDAPVFQTRWRWAASLSLAIRRWRGGKRTPPQIQRMEAEDLMAAVFPDAAACFENIEGEREVPDHPLVRQAIEDCLTEAMDIDGLERVLERIRVGGVRLIARDTPEPSPLSHELLTARPYAFLDDAPLEERRAAAVYARRALDPTTVNELGALDEAAIERVRDEAWPDPRSADELHDALLTSGFFTPREADAGTAGDSWDPWLDELVRDGRATRVRPDPAAHAATTLWIAAERLPELEAVFPELECEPPLTLRADLGEGPPAREAALVELVRGRLEILGPRMVGALAGSLGVPESEVTGALLALESEGTVLRGRFSEAARRSGSTEWCERRLLARIHRHTIGRLRAEISPVSAADFVRFLFEWQHVEPRSRVSGVEGLAAVIDQLAGYDLAAGAWEPDVLAARCDDYEPELLDRLCMTGRVVWARLAPPANGDGGPSSAPLRSSPIALLERSDLAVWLSRSPAPDRSRLSAYAAAVIEALEERGASFFHEIVGATGLMPTRVEQALGELAGVGFVTADGFAGLRALLTPSDRRAPLGGAASDRRRRRHARAPYGVEAAGRWALLERRPPAEPDIERFARALLHRYGVVFRRLVARESHAPSWRELVLFYRRLEDRGELRGGRFVTGFSGEQFALPEAVPRLRAARRAEAEGALVSVSAADPLNLTGIVSPGDRIAAVPANRVVYRDGVPVAAHEGGRIRMLVADDPPDERAVRRALVRSVPPNLRWYAGRTG